MMEYGVGEMGFITCGNHPFLVTRIRVNDLVSDRGCSYLAH